LIFQSTCCCVREIRATDLTTVRVSRISHFPNAIKVPTACFSTAMLNAVQPRAPFSFSIH
jgi:hypothetical protein